MEKIIAFLFSVLFSVFALKAQTVDILEYEAIPENIKFVEPFDMAEINPDGSITFKYIAPEAREVKVSCQFMSEDRNMVKNVAGVWSLTVMPEKKDIYPYYFIVDGIKVKDQYNPVVFPNEQFQASILEIPDPDACYTVRDVPHGRVTYMRYFSDVLEQYRTLLVYTPAAYEDGGEYPVFYLESGTTDTEETWFKVGKLDVILDNLIAGGLAEPMIVVMPNGNMGITPDPTSMAAIEKYETFSREITGCVMPFIEKSFRVKKGRANTAIGGFSRGGGQSLYTGFRHPDKFSYLCSYACYLTDEHYLKCFPDIADIIGRYSLVWFGIGTEDFLYPLVSDNFKFFDSLGIPYQKYVISGAHTWMSARAYLVETATKLFRNDAK